MNKYNFWLVLVKKKSYDKVLKHWNEEKTVNQS